mmetsp:Transcript_9563/g.26924  ORF Transcript_9563/g.26924 Transcript_9563/m.26924 type:complete len:255 (+) Transcript_9563:124-888(+)
MNNSFQGNVSVAPGAGVGGSVVGAPRRLVQASLLGICVIGVWTDYDARIVLKSLQPLHGHGHRQPSVLELPRGRGAPPRHRPGGPEHPARLHGPAPVAEVPPHAVGGHLPAHDLRADGAPAELGEAVILLELPQPPEEAAPEAHEAPVEQRPPLLVRALHGEARGAVRTEAGAAGFPALPPRVAELPVRSSCSLEAEGPVYAQQLAPRDACPRGICERLLVRLTRPPVGTERDEVLGYLLACPELAAQAVPQTR